MPDRLENQPASLPDLAAVLAEAMHAHQQGDLVRAAELYESIRSRDRRHPRAAQLLGLLKRQQGRLDDAARLLQEALEINPRSALAHVHLGMTLLDLHRAEAALQHFQLALLLKPDDRDALLQRAAALRDLGRHGEGLAVLDRALAIHGDFTEGLVDRGTFLLGLRRHEEALASCEQALRIQADHPAAQVIAGMALLALGRPREALAHLDAALAFQPGQPGVRLERGNALLALGRPAEALDDYDLALGRQPDHPQALLNRGTALLALNRPGDALASYDRALSLQPDGVEALMNRGTALVALHQLEAALAAYDQALALDPGQVEVLTNRGTALHRLGRHREAMACYDAALALQPGHLKARSNRIFVLDYLPEADFQAHQQARRDYYLAHARDLPVSVWADPGDDDPSRPLVLGYVSADFRRHSAAACFGPVLFHHDRTAFRIICYSGTTVEDDWTRRFKSCADLWRPTSGLADAELAAQVLADRVDILIDLAGHSEGNRLLAFARKPAPLQITAWGHGGGTGLPMMDIQFTDPVTIPAEVRGLFAEAAYDLPCCITFEAPDYAPAVAGLPAHRNGFVTFGSLNRFMKVTPTVLELWGQILREVPHSRLLLKDPRFDEPRAREDLWDRLSRQGIDRGRIVLRGFSSHQDHLAVYNEVDLVLDSFPQNGGITVWEALWMGAPVLALLGNKPPSRLSAAILHALGLADWVTTSPDEYRQRAVEKAQDLERLAAFRHGCRARILASPAGNPLQYTRAVEAAYRTLWTQRRAR